MCSVKDSNLKKRAKFLESFTKEDSREMQQRAIEKKLEVARLEKEKYEALPENNPARYR